MLPALNLKTTNTINNCVKTKAHDNYMAKLNQSTLTLINFKSAVTCRKLY